MQYVEHVEGVYRVAGARVSLDSIVYAFWNGQTAESIAQSFPTLTLEEVYGVITFYLARREDIDAYLVGRREEFAAARRDAQRADPMFYQRLAEARRSEQESHP